MNKTNHPDDASDFAYTVCGPPSMVKAEVGEYAKKEIFGFLPFDFDKYYYQKH